MKAALFGAIAALSFASMLPVNAQGLAGERRPVNRPRPRHARGLLGGDRTREALRRAAAAGEARIVQDLGPVDRSARSDWSQVRRVAPGAIVLITVAGNADSGLQRYFVSADDAGVTLLNVDGSNLPVAAARALRDMAAQHHDYLDGAAIGRTFVIGRLRLASTGVYLADQKVADLHDVVHTMARSEVAAIKVRQKGRGFWGHLGPLGGYFVGFMAGGFVAGTACQAVEGRDRCDTGASLKGGAVGSLAGIGYGLYAARRETEVVVYRAP